MLVVDTQTVMRGNLVVAGRIKLDGWLEGDIVCSHLEIGSDGYLLGSATARELIVGGQIVGCINAGVVQLLDGSLVEGDVIHDALTKHPGATLIGQAIRSLGFQMPPELLMLEAKAIIDYEDMEKAMHAAFPGSLTPQANGRSRRPDRKGLKRGARV